MHKTRAESEKPGKKSRKNFNTKTMKELEKNEQMEINGGETANYIGGLGPAIPESGGAFLLGFVSGFFKTLFAF